MTSTARRHIPDGYITITEAAAILDCVPMTIHRLFQRGQLTRYKDPRNNYNVLIRKSEVEQLLAEAPVAV